jgi:hypothetical protein
MRWLADLISLGFIAGVPSGIPEEQITSGGPNCPGSAKLPAPASLSLGVSPQTPATIPDCQELWTGGKLF